MRPLLASSLLVALVGCASSRTAASTSTSTASPTAAAAAAATPPATSTVNIPVTGMT